MTNGIVSKSSSYISSVKSTAKCRVKSNATIENHSILEDGRDSSILFYGALANNIIVSIIIASQDFTEHECEN
jgi:hypothetical protein